MNFKQTIFALLCAMALVGVPGAGAADWPMYLHDASHSSYNALETRIGRDNVSTLQPAWTFPAAPLASGATVVHGVVYIGDWAGNFFALRASDGSMIWKQYVGMASEPEDPSCQPPLGVTGQAVVQNGVVYVPGGDSAVYALDQNTGSQLWRVSLADPTSGSYIWSSLTLVNNSLFLGIASLGDCPLVRGQLIRIDLNNPTKPAVNYLAPQDGIGGGIWSSIAYDTQANQIFATTGTGSEDAASGTWGSTFFSADPQSLNILNYYFLPLVDPLADIEWGSSPTLFQDSSGTSLVAATAKDGGLYTLRRSDMQVAWIAKLAVSCENPQAGCGSLSTPAYDGTNVYVGAGVNDPEGFTSGSVYAFTPEGNQLWLQTLPGTVIAPVTVANGVVYVPTETGLVALDASTGDQLWSDGGSVGLYAQVVVVDGTVIAPYIDGSLVAFRPNDNLGMPLPCGLHPCRSH